MKLDFRSLQSLRPAKLFWFVAFLAIILILLFLPRSPLPWLDEVYYASAALAVVRGGPSVPTIFGAFPHVARIDLLYGPLISFLGSLEIRIFGLSATSWRLLGFWGAVGAVFSASWMSRRLDRSSGAAAAAAMIVALSQGVGARATSGRLDTVTVALELLSLACALAAIESQRSRRSGFLCAALAGIFCGLAALSTPRSFPFVLGLFVALGLELVWRKSHGLLTRVLILGTAALLPVWAWTLTQGMSPLGWLRFIALGSRGDKLNVSPVLHGTWQLFSGPLVPLLSGLLVILVMLLISGATLTDGGTLSGEENDSIPGVRLAAITVLINYVSLLVMIARFWDYEIFVVPLVVPVLTALTAKILRRGGRPVFQRAILAGWLVLAVFLVGVRSGKVVTWLVSYDQRDPRPIETLIRDRVPVNSLVFGPNDYYFYAVENAGSHYLFVKLIIPTALVSTLDQHIDWQQQLRTGQAAYLIWPSKERLPATLNVLNLRLEGSVTEPREGSSSGWRRVAGVSGYPPTSLYRIIASRDSQ
jgi:Dolichyl-phosphate-mannose-protein mannosyltransferase